MRRALYLKMLLFLIGFLPFIALAKPGLTLEQLIKIAIENNRDLKAAQYNLILAQARLKQAGLWPNPRLEIADNDDRLFTDEGEYTRSIRFQQAFPISGRISKQKNIARLDLALAEAEIRNAKRELKGQVADSFYTLLIVEARLSQLDRLLTINQQLIQVSQKRFHAAEVSELDVNTSALEYQRILQERQTQESLRVNQIAKLNQLLGRSGQPALAFDKKLPKPIPLPDMKVLQKIALKQRPEMQIARLNLHRSQAQQQLARAERWADWSVGLGIQQNKQVVDGAPPQQADRALMINVSVPLPLLNANQGRIEEANAQGIQSLLRLKAIKLAIETEVISNYRQLQALQVTMKQSQTNRTLNLINRNNKLARSAYRNGQLSLLDVLQIQRQQNDLQVAQLNLLEKYLQALVRLCIALGNYTASFCPNFSEKEF
ncbi:MULTISPECIES: TolC family protein [unclassified Legionella]|uniref:TolC family protein n=1 Tax=unclassified Legionella TaxID=2622702 RepID=UPI0010545E77|nr:MULTISPECIES: TolC family protein [unclassified Legionella]MDI9819581.1 TolC family protein [Legionella sp. PL877]